MTCKLNDLDSASKFAITGFFDSLRAEIKSTYGDVRIINVHPAYVRTNLSMNALTADSQKYNSYFMYYFKFI